MREVTSITTTDSHVWAATSGGVFSFGTASGEIKRFSTVDGLFGVDARTIDYDSRRDAIWVGYGEGVLDRIDAETGDIQTFFDIARADQFTDRTINRIKVLGDSMYVATGFGLVVFDPIRNEVRDTYSRFGPLDPGVSTTDVLFAPLPGASAIPGIWVSTSEGVVRARSDSENLQQPSVWHFEVDSPSNTNALAYFAGRVNVATDTGVERRASSGDWVQAFGSSARFSTLYSRNDELYAVSPFRIFRAKEGLATAQIFVDGFDHLEDVEFSPSGHIWMADNSEGILRIEDIGSQDGGSANLNALQTVVPSGPFLNEIGGTATSSTGDLWVSHKRVSGRVGISRLVDGAWQLFTTNNGQFPDDQSSFEHAVVTADGTFYAGSSGDGLTQIKPDGMVTVFELGNSTLQAVAGSSPDFIVVREVAEDAQGRIWMTNWAAPQPVHVLDTDGSWTALSLPPGVPSSVSFNRIIVDSFDQKWITATTGTTSGGRGVVAYSSGSDPFSPVDDQGLHLIEVGAAGAGLPHEDVRTLAFDLSGRIWIGTARGLATIFTPGSAFAGNPSLVQPQWARTVDGTSFFLRDLSINDIAVDPANQKWIASTTGAWLISAEGNEVLLNFTTDNSPLFSNNVLSVSIDESTGRVYFATDKGLLSYDSEATAAVSEVQDLDIAPAPYRPDVHSRGVLISGLVAETQIHIVTLDGQRIASLEGQGGSVRWDGRDDRTGAFVSSGIYLVSAISENGDGTAHGKIAVIR